MEKPIKNEEEVRKSGLKGERMWRTHRLEGVVKNKGIKPKKKAKRNSN